MCDHLCSECGEAIVVLDYGPICFRCFIKQEFDEHRFGDTDDPSED